MNSKKQAYIFKFFRRGAVLVLTLAPVFVFAQSSDLTAALLNNPLKFSTVQQLATAVVNALLQLAVPVAAVAIVYSGLRFVMAAGNPSEITKAKEQFYNVLIGSAIVLGAFVIMTIIRGTIDLISR